LVNAQSLIRGDDNRVTQAINSRPGPRPAFQKKPLQERIWWQSQSKNRRRPAAAPESDHPQPGTVLSAARVHPPAVQGVHVFHPLGRAGQKSTSDQVVAPCRKVECTRAAPSPRGNECPFTAARSSRLVAGQLHLHSAFQKQVYAVARRETPWAITAVSEIHDSVGTVARRSQRQHNTERHRATSPAKAPKDEAPAEPTRQEL